MYSTLVLSGGAIKGIAYIGVLKYIEENKELFDIKEIVGTSIGSFFGLCIVLGYTSQELKNIFFSYNLENLKDFKVITFFDKFGLDNGEKINKFIKSFIKNKGFDPEITMKELYIKTCKEIVITTTNVNKRETVFITKNSFPDIPVYLAIRMSMNLPFIFHPIEYNGDLYIDGITSNFPVKYLKKINRKEDTTLCIKFEEKLDKPRCIENFGDYTVQVLRSLLKTIEDTDEEYALKNNFKVIPISLNICNNIDFDISVDKKEEIYEAGYSITRQFFSQNEDLQSSE